MTQLLLDFKKLKLKIDVGLAPNSRQLHGKVFATAGERCLPKTTTLAQEIGHDERKNRFFVSFHLDSK